MESVGNDPRQLIIAGLLVLGALTALAELIALLDRARMAADIRRDVADLPTTEGGTDDN